MGQSDLLTFLRCNIQEWNTGMLAVGKAVYGVASIQTQNSSLTKDF